MRGEASATFGGLIGTIAHFLVLYGVAPAIGYEPDPFLHMGGETGAVAVFSIYVFVLGLVYPLAFYYSLQFLPDYGTLAGSIVNALPVFVVFAALDCVQTDAVATCAGIAALGALVYGVLLTGSYVQFHHEV